jgi:hypothetical protein
MNRSEQFNPSKTIKRYFIYLYFRKFVKLMTKTKLASKVSKFSVALPSAARGRVFNPAKDSLLAKALLAKALLAKAPLAKNLARPLGER